MCMVANETFANNYIFNFYICLEQLYFFIAFLRGGNVSTSEIKINTHVWLLFDFQGPRNVEILLRRAVIIKSLQIKKDVHNTEKGRLHIIAAFCRRSLHALEALPIFHGATFTSWEAEKTTASKVKEIGRKASLSLKNKIKRFANFFNSSTCKLGPQNRVYKKSY